MCCCRDVVLLQRDKRKHSRPPPFTSLVVTANPPELATLAITSCAFRSPIEIGFETGIGSWSLCVRRSNAQHARNAQRGRSSTSSTLAQFKVEEARLFRLRESSVGG